MPFAIGAPCVHFGALRFWRGQRQDARTRFLSAPGESAECPSVPDTDTALDVDLSSSYPEFRNLLSDTLSVRPRNFCERKRNEASSPRESCLAAAISSVRSVSGPPADPRSFRDCARELRLPIHPIVCYPKLTTGGKTWPRSAKSRGGLRLNRQSRIVEALRKVLTRPSQ